MTTKRKQTIEQQAVDLIHAAEEVADRYILTNAEPGISTDSVRSSMIYAYILAGLRMGPDYIKNDVRYVVGAAMKLRFGMSNEDFATDILGG